MYFQEKCRHITKVPLSVHSNVMSLSKESLRVHSHFMTTICYVCHFFLSPCVNKKLVTMQLLFDDIKISSDDIKILCRCCQARTFPIPLHLMLWLIIMFAGDGSTPQSTHVYYYVHLCSGCG